MTPPHEYPNGSSFSPAFAADVTIFQVDFTEIDHHAQQAAIISSSADESPGALAAPLASASHLCAKDAYYQWPTSALHEVQDMAA
jgi:hypothetical protein